MCCLFSVLFKQAKTRVFLFFKETIQSNSCRRRRQFYNSRASNTSSCLGRISFFFWGGEEQKIHGAKPHKQQTNKNWKHENIKTTTHSLTLLFLTLKFNLSCHVNSPQTLFGDVLGYFSKGLPGTWASQNSRLQQLSSWKSQHEPHTSTLQ